MLANIMVPACFPVDFKAELRHLCQEILFLQLELLKTLSDNPAGYAAQLTLISKAFSNVQHLINCLRPYQVRTETHAPA